MLNAKTDITLRIKKSTLLTVITNVLNQSVPNVSPVLMVKAALLVKLLSHVLVMSLWETNATSADVMVSEIKS